MQPNRIIYLPSTIKPNWETYEIRQFYTSNEFYGSSHLIPYGYALVLITYNGHNWKNLYNLTEYKMHPLGFNDTDSSFVEDLYELTEIKALISEPGREKWLFHEGEVWSSVTNTKSFANMNLDWNLVWNFFEQRCHMVFQLVKFVFVVVLCMNCSMMI